MSEIIVNVYNEDVTIGVTEIIETVTLTINENMSGDVNTINTISKNGVQLPIVLKNVDIEVPTKTSDLTNDSDFVSDADYATDKLRLANTSGTNTGDQDLSDLQTKIGATLETTATTIEAAINEVRTIALGSDIAYVFDTEADMNAWLLIPANVAKLQIGNLFLIRETTVPDYWWDGVSALELEVKIDLTNYYTKLEIDQILLGYSTTSHRHLNETITPEAIDFDLTPSTDPNTIGRLQWSAAEKTLEYGVEGGTIDVNKELFDYYVDTNNNLVEGNVVSVTGINGNRQAVTKTNNTDRASATACVGMVTHKNADNTVRITKMGRVRKLNTGGMTEGLPVYANATGGFTQTAPTAPNYFIHVGVVEVAHAVNGIIDVDIQIVYNLDDASNVDGTDTTIEEDAVLLKKDTAGLWKKVTWANVKVLLNVIFGRLSTVNTWALLQTFTSGVKTTKIISNSDTTGVVITKSDGITEVVKVDTATGISKFYIPTNGNINEFYKNGVLIGSIFSPSYANLILSSNGGRLDIEAIGGQLGLSAQNIYLQGNTILAREGDASSTATQKGSKSMPLQLSLWNGATIYRYAGHKAIASTVENLAHRIGFFVGATTTDLAASGTEVMSILSNSRIGFKTLTPETTLDVNGATTLRDWVYLNNGTHTGDAVGDRRYKVVSDVYTLQRCTANSATKGDATVGNWVTIYTNDANGFELDQYDDVFAGGVWVDAAGGAAPDTAAHTIGGIAVNVRAFDGGTTEEAFTNEFEIIHGIDIDALNRATSPLLAEIHTHGSGATTGAGVVKIFFDLAYLPAPVAGVSQAPIAWGTFSTLITINANEQYHHKLGGVELTKPSSGFNIGDRVLCKYRRTPNDAQDTYTGDWLFGQCAMHMPFNSNGSRQRYVK